MSILVEGEGSMKQKKNMEEVSRPARVHWLLPEERKGEERKKKKITLKKEFR